MSRRVRLEVDLDELHKAIADSVRDALHARDFSIGFRERTPTGRVVELSPLEPDELEGAFAEIGRNTAAALMLFDADLEDADGDVCVSCGTFVPGGRDKSGDGLVCVACNEHRPCGTVVGREDGSTFRCSLYPGHAGKCQP